MLRFLSASLGVSRCMRLLLRLSRPGVALRCCKALIAWGVAGLLLVVKEVCSGRRAPGVRDFAESAPTALPQDVVAPTLEARLLGVDGFGISPAKCRNWDQRIF